MKSSSANYQRNNLWLKIIFFFLTFLFAESVFSQSKNQNTSFEIKELLYSDDFESDLQNWIIEAKVSPRAMIELNDGNLSIDVNSGATIWFKNKLSGNLLIRCNRKVIMNNGANDRLSDLNMFWMASDPANENLFTRDGTFSKYHSLRLYYAGIGGNHNTTTRFRKYPGNGERILYGDFTDKEHLLQPNRDYLIEILVDNGTTKVYVDHEEYFSFTENSPLTEGYFGFRTVQSHQEIDNFEVYRLK